MASHTLRRGSARLLAVANPLNMPQGEDYYPHLQTNKWAQRGEETHEISQHVLSFAGIWTQLSAAGLGTRAPSTPKSVEKYPWAGLLPLPISEVRRAAQHT